MNRRNFLSGIAATIGGIVLDKAVPFGRVYSFPKHIVSLNCAEREWWLTSSSAGRHYDLVVYDDLIGDIIGRQFDLNFKNLTYPGNLHKLGTLKMRVPTDILENV